MSFNKLPETPTDFNLYINHACQTLSKAFIISKNTPYVLRVGLAWWAPGYEPPLPPPPT